MAEVKFSRIGIVLIVSLFLTFSLTDWFLAVIVFVICKIRRKKKNEEIERINKENIEKNNQLAVQEEQLIQKLRDITQSYYQTVGRWYPENYCSVDAAEFFYTAVKNYRADTLKEAINLYEDVMHKRRVELNQKQALEEQRYANMMATSNMIIQAAQLNNINDNLSRLNAKVPYIY